MAAWRVESLRRGVGRLVAAALFLLVVGVVASGCAASTAPAARATLTPTATANPLIPTPTAAEARVNALVRQAVGSGPQQIQTIYHTATGEVEVNLTLVGNVPTAPTDVSAKQEQVKTLCFEAQQAAWASGLAPLSQVTVTVLGPVVVLYGDQVTQAYGAVILKAATAARFTWSALSPDGAWKAYDNAYLRSGYYDPD